MARPFKEFDQDTFEKLAEIACTEAEICSVLGLTDKTLNIKLKQVYDLNYSELLKTDRFFGKMKASLRRAQFKAALAGNTTMMVWLGKQFLGQVDKNKLTLDASVNYEGLTDEELKKKIEETKRRADKIT